MANLIKKIRTSSGDLQIDYNALANLPTISNPNLLINANFRDPVNQRTKTSYSSDANNFTRIYTIDRWNIQNGTSLTVNDNSITLIGNTASTGLSLFSQILEYSYVDNYVLQVKVLSLTGGAVVDVYNKASQVVVTLNLAAGLNTIKIENSDILFVQIGVSSGSVVELEYIKLEQGTIATPFVPRLHAEEVAMCRRYYRKYSHGYFIGLALATSGGIVFTEQQEPMRIAEPTLRVTDTTIFNPLVKDVDKYVTLTSGYSTMTEYAQFVSFDLGTATAGEMGRIYGEFELDAEIY